MPRIAAASLHSLFDFGLRKFPQLQSKGHVVVDRHVRIERVILEDHRDIAVLRRDVVDPLSPMRMSPLEISSRPAIIRSVVDFPQPGWPDEHDELAVFDLETDVR